MEHKIKLRTKQLQSLINIQTQMAQLNKALAELNQNQNLILELLVEEQGITNKITNVQLDQVAGVLIFEEVEEAPKATKKAKGKAVAEPVLKKAD